MFEGLRVLVVDDQKIIQDMLVSLLLKLGFDAVDTANDGSQALQALDKNRYDLILCDIMMKDINGIEFVRTLRQSANLRFDASKSSTPVMLISGSSDPSHIRAAKEVGVQGYILKPFNPAEIKKRLHKLFSRRPETRVPEVKEYRAS